MVLYTEIAILAVILIIATISEVRTAQINPFIWMAGGIIAFVYNFFRAGFCPFFESIVTVVIVFFLIVIMYIHLQEIMGGGIIKGMIMMSAFLGWKAVFTFIFFVAIFSIYIKLKERQSRDLLPGESIGLGMPSFDIAVLLNIAVVLCLM